MEQKKSGLCLDGSIKIQEQANESASFFFSLLDNGGHHRSRRVSVPGGAGVLLVLEVDRGVAELEVADLGGRGSLRHQGDCIRTTRKERGAVEGSGGFRHAPTTKSMTAVLVYLGDVHTGTHTPPPESCRTFSPFPLTPAGHALL